MSEPQGGCQWCFHMVEAREAEPSESFSPLLFSCATRDCSFSLSSLAKIFSFGTRLSTRISTSPRIRLIGSCQWQSFCACLSNAASDSSAFRPIHRLCRERKIQIPAAIVPTLEEKEGQKYIARYLYEDSHKGHIADAFDKIHLSDHRELILTPESLILSRMDLPASIRFSNNTALSSQPQLFRNSRLSRHYKHHESTGKQDYSFELGANIFSSRSMAESMN